MEEKISMRESKAKTCAELQEMKERGCRKLIKKLADGSLIF